MQYSILSLLCLLALAAIAITYVTKILLKWRNNREECIAFIRKFKKGSCAIIYFVAIPIYCMGHIYAGQAFLPAFFSAINKCIILVVLRYDMSSISALMSDNTLYGIAVYFCFFLVAANAIILALSLTHQKIWEWMQSKRWELSKREKLLLVGNNDDNICIYASEQKRLRAIVDVMDDKAEARLFSKGICFFSQAGFFSKNADIFTDSDTVEAHCLRLINRCRRKKDESGIIIINTKNDEQNIALCRKIISFFGTIDAEMLPDVLSKIKVYVFGQPAHEAIYARITDISKGCIRYINKYGQIATDFINRYPLTSFMTADQIDFERSLIKPDAVLNVVMIGFGKTNQQIFHSSVANNQFLAEKDGKICLKQVQYHIFDRSHLENNKNLNHSYYRFRNEFEDDIRHRSEHPDAEQTYLPFPDFPAKEYYHKLDVNDPEFYKTIKSAVTVDGSYSYAVIAFGTDLENVDMAQRIVEKKLEWNVKNLYIFVKVRGDSSLYPVFDRDDCFAIGDERSTVHNIDIIDDDEIVAMAKLRSKIYELESAKKSGSCSREEIDAIYNAAEIKWYVNTHQLMRESNMYACLSLRSKLQLMGLDYCLAGQSPSPALTASEYISHYAKGDIPSPYKEIIERGDEIESMEKVVYGIDFSDSRRTTMAIQEHYRWNSYMISKGFIPASIGEIREDANNGKDYTIRRHGNITTMDGLVRFRKIVAEKTGRSEADTDVIKYDYQLLDEAYWILSESNYVIFKRNSGDTVQ